LKILFIHPRLNVFGGAERVLIHMLKALQDNELSLIADRWSLKDVENIFGTKPIGVKWIKCSSFHPLYQHFVAFQWLYFTRKLNRLIREVSPDYDLLIETQQVYSDPAPGTPLINYIHYPSLAAPPPESPSFASSIYYAILRFLILRRIKKISLALTNSPFTAKKIAQYLKIEPAVVHPPVDVKKFFSDCAWSDRENKVVSIGMFVPFKRYNLLLEVARQIPNIQFVIIGAISEDYGDYYQKLRMQKPDNVTIRPDVTFDEVKEELASAKAYVHLCPEHFGISVVEAAAAGCVPIVYKIGGPAECLGNAALTWQDLTQLSEHISNLIKDEDLWSELSERAQAKALEFDASIFEQRIRNIVEKRLWKHRQPEALS